MCTVSRPPTVDAEVRGELLDRRVPGRRDDAVDVGDREPGVGDRGVGRLEHQLHRQPSAPAHVVGLADADDRRRARQTRRSQLDRARSSTAGRHRRTALRSLVRLAPAGTRRVGAMPYREAVEVRAVLTQRRDARVERSRSRRRRASAAAPRHRRRSARPDHGSSPSSSSSVNTHRLPASRAASSAAIADDAVVGHVHAADPIAARG